MGGEARAGAGSSAGVGLRSKGTPAPSWLRGFVRDFPAGGRAGGRREDGAQVRAGEAAGGKWRRRRGFRASSGSLSQQMPRFTPTKNVATRLSAYFTLRFSARPATPNASSASAVGSGRGVE